MTNQKPWRYDVTLDGRYTIFDSNCRPLAYCLDPEVFSVMTLATEMLEALEIAAHVMDGVVLEDEVYRSTKETLENEIKHIRSLVAKAKGEQPCPLRKSY